MTPSSHSIIVPGKWEEGEAGDGVRSRNPDLLLFVKRNILVFGPTGLSFVLKDKGEGERWDPDPSPRSFTVF